VFALLDFLWVYFLLSYIQLVFASLVWLACWISTGKTEFLGIIFGEVAIAPEVQLKNKTNVWIKKVNKFPWAFKFEIQCNLRQLLLLGTEGHLY
jgi:hypothetical protein